MFIYRRIRTTAKKYLLASSCRPSVSAPIHMHVSVRLLLDDFSVIRYWRLLWKSVEIIQILLKWGKYRALCLKAQTRIFVGVIKSLQKRSLRVKWSQAVSPSVCTHVSALLSLGAYPWNLILGFFNENVSVNSNLVKIVQNYRVPYMQT